MYKIPLVFWSMGELGILLLRFTDLYYDTSGRLVFVYFLEEIEDTKKTFGN